MSTPITQNIPLYLFGILGDSSNSMNLFLNASANEEDSEMPLFLYGMATGSSNQYNSIPLFIIGGEINSYLNLFLTGYDAGSSGEELNLYLDAQYNLISNSVNLILVGTGTLDGLYDLSLEQLDELSLFNLLWLPLAGSGFIGWSFNNQISLYIEGSGISNGCIPSAGNLNLFLEAPNGVGKSLPLYISGQLSEQIPLYLQSVLGIISNIVNLYLTAVNKTNTTFPLFIRGYNPLEL